MDNNSRTRAPPTSRHPSGNRRAAVGENQTTFLGVLASPSDPLQRTPPVHSGIVAATARLLVLQTPGVESRQWGAKCGVMKRPQQSIALRGPAFEHCRDAGLVYPYVGKHIDR